MMKMEKLGVMISTYGLALAFVGLSAIPVNAQTTKWVDQIAGSDANDGNTEGTAYATLQFAIDNSTGGIDNANQSIIHVKDGTYGVSGGQMNVDHCGSGGFPTAILIEGLDYLARV